MAQVEWAPASASLSLGAWFFQAPDDVLAFASPDTAPGATHRLGYPFGFPPQWKNQAGCKGNCSRSVLWTRRRTLQKRPARSKSFFFRKILRVPSLAVVNRLDSGNSKRGEKKTPQTAANRSFLPGYMARSHTHCCFLSRDATGDPRRNPSSPEPWKQEHTWSLVL